MIIVKKWLINCCLINKIEIKIEISIIIIKIIRRLINNIIT